MKTSEANTTAKAESPQRSVAKQLRREASYFTIQELTASATALREGIDNRPPESAYHLLHVLVRELLDPIRKAWGEPIIVSSGYRCKQLNALVGGTKHSHHMLGCAADIIGGLPLSHSRRGGTTGIAGNKLKHPQVKTNKTLFDFIVQMQQEGHIKFTQLILEQGGRWIHLSYVPGDLRCQVIECP